ncbi:MAG: GNAT family N-acetyltransferase [Erysipelotrichaceae bacterium]|nr:GNAT family N-acetyltransferase [Erysipelotrichaceae bacterium]
MEIKLEEVIEAIDNTDANTQFFYYIPEERIIERDDSIKEKYLIPLPTHKEIDDYATMKMFIEEKTDGEAQEWLRECIRGAGAFRRFRSTLERFGLSEDWLEYRSSIHEGIALDWCEYYGIEYLEDSAPYQKTEEPAPVFTKTEKKHSFRFVDINEDNLYNLAYLAVDFRKTLSSLKNQKPSYDVDDAIEELREDLRMGDRYFAVTDNGRYVGYASCRIQNDVVWLSSLYVRPENRRKGIGKLLLEKAEAIAEEYGNDTLYMYVHPNNELMIPFLASQGYDVLNLIEIRKAHREEEPSSTYSIGDHTYKY